MKIFLATNNHGKVKEINKLFEGSGIEFLIAEGNFNYSSVETGNTYKINAYKKAKYLYTETGSNTPSLAEDSGLEVEALNGAPGVHSARFANTNATDKENNNRLLELLSLETSNNRNAKFVSIFCLISKDGEFYFEGEVKGQIALSLKGEHGFGYDPLFIPEGYDKTFAQLGPEFKNAISHRAKAISKLKNLFFDKKIKDRR
ncbi:MAG: RdgB/HAM1 family non-canonical purine NTP pyrophosphatase [Candidatus Magnetoovum sp. WYHC-5]|nr:RdgB/HAM1 family non-canonical purine NTP pyrophosphatase [Candidatus Magnetoovum sp. WYHC-5]